MANLSQIEIFLEVVKHQSFIKAAHVLGITGPAVSKQIQALEDRLGIRLLNRTTRLISLTEEGLIYSRKAEKALSDLREAEQEILESKTCPTGPLKLSVPVSFGIQYLIEPINAYMERYPNVALEVIFDDRRVDLTAENFDVAVRVGALEDSRLIARKIHSCPIVLCASPKLLDDCGMPDLPHALSKYPAIIYNKHSNDEMWRYSAPTGEQAYVKLHRKMTTNTAELLLHACLAGVGIAALPMFVCFDYLKSGALVQILPEYQTYPQSDIYVIYKSKEYISARLLMFLEMMVEFGANLPW